ncbi:MAG: hypothetical protein ACRD2J_08430 [Thermoanaerobaculia bacterium]
MNRNLKLVCVLTSILALASLGACKHSGVAVASGGQIINIEIDAPNELAENFETEELEVEIANVGVNKLADLEFTVEMPTEIVVLSQTQSPGVTWTERVTVGGTKLYHYVVNEVDAGSQARVNYHVRTAFGARDRTGDIKVTAWSDQLPGDRLIETEFIRLAD